MIWKSWNMKVTRVEFVVVPLVAVTVAVSVSAVGELQDSVEVSKAAKAMLAGFTEHVALPVVDTVRSTLPVKVPRVATLIVEVPPGEPTLAVTLVGLASRLIPGLTGAVTVTDMAAVELVMSLLVPPVPVNVTV